MCSACPAGCLGPCADVCSVCAALRVRSSLGLSFRSSASLSFAASKAPSAATAERSDGPSMVRVGCPLQHCHAAAQCLCSPPSLQVSTDSSATRIPGAVGSSARGPGPWGSGSNGQQLQCPALPSLPTQPGQPACKSAGQQPDYLQLQEASPHLHSCPPLPGKTARSGSHSGHTRSSEPRARAQESGTRKPAARLGRAGLAEQGPVGLAQVAERRGTILSPRTLDWGAVMWHRPPPSTHGAPRRDGGEARTHTSAPGYSSGAARRHAGGPQGAGGGAARPLSQVTSLPGGRGTGHRSRRSQREQGEGVSSPVGAR
jgi:hypothetical protein